MKAMVILLVCPWQGYGVGSRRRGTCTTSYHGSLAPQSMRSSPTCRSGHSGLGAASFEILSAMVPEVQFGRPRTPFSHVTPKL